MKRLSMINTTYIKSCINKIDLLFILLYLGMVFLYPKALIYIKNIEFIRGFYSIDKMNNMLYVSLIIWIMYNLIPIFYLSFTFCKHFEASYYYFVRIENRSKWLLTYFLKACFILALCQLLRTLYLTFYFKQPIVIDPLIFIRDTMYLISLFSIYLVGFVYVKRNLSFVLVTIGYILLCFGDISMYGWFLLSSFHFIELIFYIFIIIICFFNVVYCLNRRLDKIDLS